MSVKYFDKSSNQWKIFPGTTGLPGKDGKDCFDVARENGYTGTKEDYYKLLTDITDINVQVKENTEAISNLEAKIPDTSNFATKEELATKANTTDLANYATTASVSQVSASVTSLSGDLQDLTDIVDNKADSIDLANYARKTDLNTVKTTAESAKATADNAATSVNDLNDVVTEYVNDLTEQLNGKMDGTDINGTKATDDNVVTGISIDSAKKLTVTYGKIKATGISEMYPTEEASITDNAIILIGNRTLYNTTATSLKVAQIDTSEGYDGIIISDTKITWQKSDNYTIYLSPDINDLKTGNKYIYSFQIMDDGTTDIYINGSSYVVCA